jgi:hypothetical protein
MFALVLYRDAVNICSPEMFVEHMFGWDFIALSLYRTKAAGLYTGEHMFAVHFTALSR